MPEISCFGIIIRCTQALGGHRLYLRFEDGVEGEVDLSKLIEFRRIFAPLGQADCFAKVTVDPEIGTVCWPNGADLDPDVLYSAVTGQPIELRQTALAS